MARATVSAVTALCSGHFGPPLLSMTWSKNSVSVVPGLTTSTSMPARYSGHPVLRGTRYSGRGELGPDRLAESVYGELAGRVFAVMRHAAATEDRTDIDDDRPATLLEQGQGGAGHLDQGEEVDLHQPPHTLGIGRLEGTDRAHARIVHEDVQAAELRLGRLDALRSGGRIGNVARHARGTPAKRFDFLGQGLQAIFPPGHADHFAALPGEFQRDRPADAAGGAGHDRSTSLDGASHGRSLLPKGTIVR